MVSSAVSSADAGRQGGIRIAFIWMDCQADRDGLELRASSHSDLAGGGRGRIRPVTPLCYVPPGPRLLTSSVLLIADFQRVDPKVAIALAGYYSQAVTLALSFSHIVALGLCQRLGFEVSQIC